MRSARNGAVYDNVTFVPTVWLASHMEPEVATICEEQLKLVTGSVKRTCT